MDHQDDAEINSLSPIMVLFFQSPCQERVNLRLACNLYPFQALAFSRLVVLCMIIFRSVALTEMNASIFDHDKI